MNTIQAMIGSEELILSHFGLPPITGNKHFKGPCCLCGKCGKFRLSRRDNRVAYICSCGNGSMINLIERVTGLNFKTIAEQIDRLIGHTFRSDNNPRLDTPKHVTALNKFNGYSSIRDSPAQEYLNSRGIYSIPPKSVRYKPSTDRNGHTALMAIVSDDSFNACYIHQTILDGAKKADVEAPRKLHTLQDESHLKYCSSPAIRMFPLASTIGIAEGIETALAARQVYQCTVWSTVNAALMRRFKAPNGVEHLIIFADNDTNGTGHAAAFECANKNILANNDLKKVSIRWPSVIGDFNDMLQKGSEVFEWILTRK